MCSGVLGDGSLRIVRNGIGMIEQVGSCACASSGLSIFHKLPSVLFGFAGMG